MRLIAFVLAALVAGGGSAAAQSWKEYSDAAYSFAINFPADPKIETTSYQVADGRSVPARVYSVHQKNGVFQVTVAELANTALNEAAVIAHAIRKLSESGEVKINIPHRVYQVYGRQLSVLGADGSRAMVALFDYKGRFYQIEAETLPGGSDIDMIRFQQSLNFTDGGSNRSPEAIRAIREACGGDVVNPAGPDDPRCPQARH